MLLNVRICLLIHLRRNVQTRFLRFLRKVFTPSFTKQKAKAQKAGNNNIF